MLIFVQVPPCTASPGFSDRIDIPQSYQSRIEEAPKGSEAYDCAYKEAMDRILGQISASRELAMRVLWWIAFTTKPLTTPAELELLINNLFESQTKVSSCSQAMMVGEPWVGYSQYVSRGMTGAHLAAYFGLGELMMTLLKNGHNPRFAGFPQANAAFTSR